VSGGSHCWPVLITVRLGVDHTLIDQLSTEIARWKAVDHK
jgi:hypothetical protein